MHTQYTRRMPLP